MHKLWSYAVSCVAWCFDGLKINNFSLAVVPLQWLASFYHPVNCSNYENKPAKRSHEPHCAVLAAPIRHITFRRRANFVAYLILCWFAVRFPLPCTWQPSPHLCMHIQPVYLACSDFTHIHTQRTLYECEIAPSCTQALSMGCNNTFHIDKFHRRKIQQRHHHHRQSDALTTMRSNGFAHFHLTKSDKWHLSFSFQEIPMQDSHREFIWASHIAK